MKIFWQRFLALLTPGVRILLALLVAVCFAALVGKSAHTFDLYGWLALSGAKFWGGQIWRIVTYALLPNGILDFVMNSFALVILGGQIERHWSRDEFWFYCLIAVVGAGFAKILLSFLDPSPLVGMAPMNFGLLMAWGFLCGRETVSLVPFGEITVWKIVLFGAGISFLITVFTAGVATAIIMSAGGAIGWLYLWLKLKWLMSRTASAAHSERITRLEL